MLDRRKFLGVLGVTPFVRDLKSAGESAQTVAKHIPRSDTIFVPANRPLELGIPGISLDENAEFCGLADFENPQIFLNYTGDSETHEIPSGRLEGFLGKGSYILSLEGGEVHNSFTLVVTSDNCLPYIRNFQTVAQKTWDQLRP